MIGSKPVRDWEERLGVAFIVLVTTALVLGQVVAILEILSRA